MIKPRFANVLLIHLVTLMLILIAGAATFAAAPETLTITGDGVSRQVVFDRAQLEAMQAGISRSPYSVTNNFPTDKTMYRQGVSLQHLLEQAGVKPEARQLKFISSDGYSRTFTYQELIQDTRYYYPQTGSPVQVPTTIAFKDSFKGFGDMQNVELCLTMGQRVKGEQNHPWFVKYLQTIEVSTAEPEQWVFPTFKPLSATEVQLWHPNFDMVKLYYTTDGSQPNINSKLYNVSASYYQPQFNRPITANPNTVIKTIAIGAGKRDSEVAANTIPAGNVLFNDLDAAPWASTAIQQLNQKGIIEGMGDGRFAPLSPLTRAQFAKMMVLALGQSPDVTFQPVFNDVTKSDWHWPYVQAAARLGLIEGYSSGTFGPDRSLSREEMLTIAVRAIGVQGGSAAPELLSPFAAETRVSDWARPYLANAEAMKILEHGHIAVETGSGGLAINAQAQANRAEAAATIYLILERKS